MEDTKMGELLRRAKENDRIWKPTKAGEALEGLLVKIRQVHFGRVFMVRGVAYDPDGKPVDDHEVTWVVNVGKESTLSTKVDEAGAVEGCMLAIVYNGTRKSKSGREFNLWAVAVD